MRDCLYTHPIIILYCYYTAPLFNPLTIHYKHLFYTLKPNKKCISSKKLAQSLLLPYIYTIKQ